MNPSRPSLLDPQLLWATFALVATLLLGALVLAWFDRLRKRPDPSVLSPAEQLAAFRLSYERGEMSQREYERIRSRLAPHLKGGPTAPPAPGPKSTPTTPPAPAAETEHPPASGD